MKYLSVCSGVGTDHLAWEPLGWQCVGFAEIDPFASAILAHRYPKVRNYGDFTKIPADLGPIDVLVGGTPCQSFSVAGQRAGLDDPRGNLTLEFARLARKLRPCWFVWENVPGVLSSDGGRDFAAILTAFRECGYSVCYRVLDAQHFGVPQRRRRVFVVGHLGDDWRPSAEVLLEPVGVRGHPPAGKATGQDIAGTVGGGSGSRGWSNDLDRTTFIPVEIDASRVNGCLTTTYGSKNYSNHEEVMSGSVVSGHFALAVRPAQTGANGIGVAEDVAHTLDGAQGQAVAFSAKDYGGDAGPLSPTLRAGTSDASHANGGVMPPVALIPPPGQDVVTFGTKETNPVGVLVPDPIAFDAYDSVNAHPGAIANPLRARGGEAVSWTASEQSNGFAWERPQYPTLTAGAPTDTSNIQHGIRIGTVVRRLTPRECERLQGLPDDWTLVPYRGKPASDGPRYKAIGNGMAMPVLRWIGQRIAMVEASNPLPRA